MIYLAGRRALGTLVLGISIIAAAQIVQAQCVGDCNSDNRVAINELVIGVNILLGRAPVTDCVSLDTDGGGSVRVNELVQAVMRALEGCPSPTVSPSPTPTPIGSTESPSPSPTAPTSTPTPPGPTSTPTETPIPVPPEIFDFNPKAGSAGTLVTIEGSNFAPWAGLFPLVTMSGQRGLAISVPVASFRNDSVVVTIPTGAATGPLTVTVGPNADTSNDQFAIEPSSTFSLTGVPANASAIRGHGTSYRVCLSSSNGFVQLAELTVNGLPESVAAVLTPKMLAAGGCSLLKVVPSAEQPIGPIEFQVSASAAVDGMAISQVASLTLGVEEVTTSFMGRTVVDDALQTALPGVTITLLGVDGEANATGCSGQTVSDEAGNFAFTNLRAECEGPQLIRYNGLTATAPGQFAGVDLLYDIVPGQVTESPVLIHLPRIDNAETVCVEQNAAEDQEITFETIPNLTATVYAGTTFTPPPPEIGMPIHDCEDGFYPLIAVDVPVDRLPDEMPPGATVEPFIVAFQPANTIASQPVAVSFPNLLNTPPGTIVDLSTLDPTKGVMVVYGSGTVSANGLQIVPNFDPSNPGKRFGLVHFDWHGPRIPPPPPGPPEENPAPPNSPPVGGPEGPLPGAPPCAGDPIDLSSGVAILVETDLKVNGLRGSIAIRRVYRTLSQEAGPFGLGSSHNYGYRLDTNSPESEALIDVVMPDGNRFPFALTADGVWRNSTVPGLRGAAITVPSAGEAELRWKNGTVFRFIGSGTPRGALLAAISDRVGNQITLMRNTALEIAEVVDPVGRSLRLKYDGAGRVTELSDGIGSRVFYRYNGQGTLEAVTDSAGGVTRYGYDDQNRLTKITDPRGVVTERNTYDENGRVVEQVRSDGSVLRFEYQLANPEVPSGPVLETAVLLPETETIVDPLLRRMTYRFNPEGFVTDITNALGQTRVFAREAGTNLVTRVEGCASCGVCGESSAGDQSFEYDEVGNPVKLVDGRGQTYTFDYEATFNRLASIVDPLGNETVLSYDDRGNVVSITNARMQTWEFEYNEDGVLMSVSDPLLNQWRIEHDAASNPSEIRDPKGNSTHIVYDGNSRPIRVTDPLGRQTLLTWDREDRLLSLTNGLGQRTDLRFDLVGNLLTVVDGRGNARNYSYDSRNRLVSHADPVGNSDLREYDARGNLIRFLDRRGRESLFQYDPLGRLISEEYEDANVIRSYDSRGRLTGVEDSASGGFSFEFDRAGDLVKSAGPYGTVLFVRDELGRISVRQVVGQPSVGYVYDEVGSLEEAVSLPASVTLEYEERGLVERIVRSNGVVTTYGYDDLGRLVRLSHEGEAGSLDVQTYEYDASGKVVGASSELGSFAKPSVSSIVIDPQSNRILEQDGQGLTYDRNGNRLSRETRLGSTNFEWDSRNRLVGIREPNGTTTNLEYDFTRSLVAMEYVTDSSQAKTSFLYDTYTNVVFQSAPGDGLSFLTGAGIDEHYAVASPDGGVFFALRNSIKSTVAEVDNAGLLVSKTSYEPFGGTPGAGEQALPFRFAGRVPVASDFYYFRARYYDASVARFVSEDPIGVFGGSNLYSYVRNDPVSRTDPLGFGCILWIFCFDLPEQLIGGAIGVLEGASAPLRGEEGDYASALGDFQRDAGINLAGAAFGATQGTLAKAVSPPLSTALGSRIGREIPLPGGGSDSEGEPCKP